MEIPRTAASLPSRRGRQMWSKASPAGVPNCQIGSEEKTILRKQVAEGTCLSYRWSGKVSWRKWPSNCNLKQEQKLKEVGGERGERACMSMYMNELSCPHTPPKVSVSLQCHHRSAILGFKDNVFHVSSLNASQQGYLFFSGETAIQPQHWGKTERCWEGLRCQPPCGIRKSDFDHGELIVGINIVSLSQGWTWNSGKFSSVKPRRHPGTVKLCPVR